MQCNILIYIKIKELKKMELTILILKGFCLLTLALGFFIGETNGLILMGFVYLGLCIESIRADSI
jgi:hypothetical protein